MRKLSGKINGQLITKEFFPLEVGNERQINCGDCYRWAYIAYKLYEEVDLYSTEHHAFPYQRGYFFDSESPYGEEDLEDLACNKICRAYGHEGDAFFQEEDDFEEFWADNGSFYDRKELDKAIKNFWRRYDRKERKNQQC